MEFNNSKESAQLKASGAGRQLRARHGRAQLNTQQSSPRPHWAKARAPPMPPAGSDRIGSGGVMCFIWAVDINKIEKKKWLSDSSLIDWLIESREREKTYRSECSCRRRRLSSRLSSWRWYRRWSERTNPAGLWSLTSLPIGSTGGGSYDIASSPRWSTDDGNRERWGSPRLSSTGVCYCCCRRPSSIPSVQRMNEWMRKRNPQHKISSLQIIEKSLLSSWRWATGLSCLKF